MEINNQEIQLKKAQERVAEMKGFYVHLMIFIVTTLISLIIGYILSYQLFMVFLVSMLGWAIGVGVHGINVFGINIFLGKDWEERKLKEIMDQQQADHHA
jgi:hypothetical protein